MNIEENKGTGQNYTFQKMSHYPSNVFECILNVLTRYELLNAITLIWN